MFRRLHSRMVGMGSICGLTRTSPPAELFLKSLPPPLEVNPQRFERFKAEEEVRLSSAPQGRCGSSLPFNKAPEPFYDFVCGDAGHKHVVLLLSDGNLVSFGDNTYGQTGAPLTSRYEKGSSTRNRQEESHAPLYIDLGDTVRSSSLPISAAQVACGSNFSFVYLKGGRRVVAFGNNHVGQLGVGHKNVVDSTQGFEAWNPLASWWPDSEVVIDSITCGFNHSVVQLTDDSLYSFGSNTWGELGIGSTTSPMFPTRITYFDERGVKIKKVSAGNSFTLFLSEEGKVYGCGATDEGQLPSNAFEPVVVPIGRHFVRSADGTSIESRKAADPTKLIRVKDIACVGSLAVYLTSRNEILLQGGLPDYGYTVRSPRLRLLRQEKAINTFSKHLGCDGAHIEKRNFVVDELQSGPQTVLLKYRNGCVGGLGSNAEGELCNVLKRFHGRDLNVAPAFSHEDVFPVMTPIISDYKTYSAPWFVLGKGFSLLIDNDSVFPLREEGLPLELPSSVAAGERSTTKLRDALSGNKTTN